MTWLTDSGRRLSVKALAAGPLSVFATKAGTAGLLAGNDAAFIRELKTAEAARRPCLGATVISQDMGAYEAVRQIAGYRPKILQIDITTVETKAHASLAVLRALAHSHTEAGGLLMLCHHTGNPWYPSEMAYSVGHKRGKNLGRGSAWDLQDAHTAVPSLLPGGANRAKFVRYLDYMAEAISTLKVQVMWRPFHESNLGGFWWGGAGAEAFRALWMDTVKEMRQRASNVLICASFAQAFRRDAAKNMLLPWYAGSAYSDCLGLDLYSSGGDFSVPALHLSWLDLLELDPSRRLPIMLSEFGGKKKSAHDDADFWQRAGQSLSKLERLSAAVMWTSDWAPRVGALSEQGFREAVRAGRWRFLER